jgi:hypothetical protein
MENAGIFYGHLSFFTASWKFCGHRVYFPPVLVYCTRKKSGNPFEPFSVKKMSSIVEILPCPVTLRGPSRGPFLTLPLGANFDLRGEVVPQG